MEVSKMSERIKRNWPEIIKDQETSGKTIAIFCKERGIHYTAFYKNRKQLKSNNFVEVKIKNEVKESGHPITLKYGEYSVILPPGFCKQTLSEVLSVLGS